MFLQAFAALTFQNAERNLSPKNSSHPQVPMIMPSFVRRMVPIWDPCPKLHGSHAAAPAPAMPNGSVPKWSLNASQRHANLWPLGNRNKKKGGNIGKQTDEFGKAWRFYTQNIILKLIQQPCLDVFGHMFFVDGFEFECYLH